jgi:uncharacterized protein YndB with AHSA1/START domain
MAHELVLERTINAPRAAVWRCLTEPALLMQWYCPKPWQVTHADLNLTVGGRHFVRMQGPGPDGQTMTQDCPGCYLEIVPLHKLVTTDAFNGGWIPSAFNEREHPFMVVEMTLADAPNGGTRYKAIVRHWNATDAAAHEAMGFHAGWGAAADQLEVLAASL